MTIGLPHKEKFVISHQFEIMHFYKKAIVLDSLYTHQYKVLLLNLNTLRMHNILTLGLLPASQYTEPLLKVPAARVILFVVTICASTATRNYAILR